MERDLVKAMLTIKRGFVTINHYLSLKERDGVMFCGFLADVLHNVPKLIEDTPASRKRYCVWINQIGSQSNDPFALVFDTIFDKKPSNILYMLASRYKRNHSMPV